MASGTPSTQVRIPVEDLVFSPPPPAPPLMLTLYYFTITKSYPVAQKFSGGVKFMQRQKSYPVAE